MQNQNKTTTDKPRTNKRVILRKTTAVSDGIRYKSEAARNFSELVYELAERD